MLRDASYVAASDLTFIMPLMPLFYDVLSGCKVVSVRPAGIADVWDLTVERTHNFALSAGVFVHNCDPVEELSYLIKVPDVDGTEVSVNVSDFVFDAWFDTFAETNGRTFNMLGTLTRPLTLSPGGYVVTIDTATGKTSETFGSPAGRARHLTMKPTHVASRTARRQRSR
jgi:hypothetical protein